jgi:hypothetical protein
MPQIYDPWRDRIMVSGNGFNEDDPASALGQEPLNNALSIIFADPNEPRIVISAGRSMKHFAVGYRVMATRNEPPDMANRVTNGMTGRITDIKPNEAWDGDWRMVGTEEEVKANREIMLAAALGKQRGIFPACPCLIWLRVTWTQSRSESRSLARLWRIAAAARVLIS